MGKRWRWGVIIDAGSSGSRVYTYRWKDPAKQQKVVGQHDLQLLPKVETDDDWTMKIRPGISTFGSHPEDVGSQHLKDLIDHALSIVPANKVADTPFFLMATAGMRLLPKSQQRAILDSICNYVQDSTDFSLPNCHHQIQVIPGETEGLYGWIATNYLLGGFDRPENHDHGQGHHTYGFLDMGGASAQIAFAPNSTETEKHSHDLKLLRLRTLNGKAAEHKVFTTTWLGYGVNQARDRYITALQDKYDGKEAEIPDPCMPTGIRTTSKGDLVEAAAAEGEVTLVGTGKFGQCLAETYPLLGKDAPCKEDPCLLNGQHVPAIDFKVNHFIGVSEYWHTTHGVFGSPGHDAAYEFDTYLQNVSEFCSKDWNRIEATVATHKKPSKNEKDIKNAQEACFKASWLLNVLYDGIGIPKISSEDTSLLGANTSSEDAVVHTKDKGFLNPFQPVDEIDDMEVSWTLGPVVLYASGQVPPTGTAMPVGFGSNEGGIPADFSYAGSNYTLGISDDSSWADTTDDIIETATTSSGHSFLLFTGIIIAAFFLWHREKRRRLLSFIISCTRRKGKPGSLRRGFGSGPLAIANKIFGRGSGGYERVMEDGELGQFELDTESDDSDRSGSSEGSRLGMTSGLATPTLNVDINRFEDVRKPVGGFERRPLAVRTESRDRLVPAQMITTGRRSRAASPSRLLKSSLAGSSKH